MALTDNLLGWWKCDETSGTVYDSTANNLDSSAQSYSSGTGVIDNCLTFNGSSNYIEFGAVAQPTSAMSVAFWMRSDGVASERFIICNTAWSTNWYGWRITLYSGGDIGVVMCSGNDAQMLDISAASGMDDGDWHHFVVTWNGSTVYTYYDGGNKSAGDSWGYTLAYTGGCSLHFGSNEEHNSSWFDGDLDLVGIWSSALTDQEVSDLYNSGAGFDYPFSAGGGGGLAGYSNGVAWCQAYILGSGDTYYIDPSGSDSTGTGTSGNPWQSLYKACQSVTSSGDTIHVNSGSYPTDTRQCELSEGVNIQGAGEGITTLNIRYTGGASLLLYTSNGWTSATDAQYISGVKFEGNSSGYSCIEVDYRSNVRIHDCTIQNYTHHAIIFYGMASGSWSTTSVFEDDRYMPNYFCTGNMVYDCTLYNNSQTGDGGQIRMGQQDGIEIYGNYIEQPEAGSGVNCGGIKFHALGYNKNEKVHNNTIIVYPNTGNQFNFSIEIWYCLGGGEYYENTCEGGADFDCGYKGSADYSIWFHDNEVGYDDHIAHNSYGINFEAAFSDVIIESNYVHHTCSGILFSMIWPSSGSPPDAHPYRNNLTNILIYNNKLVKLGRDHESGVDWEPVYGIIFSHDGYWPSPSPSYVDDIYIWNNIIECTAYTAYSGYVAGIYFSVNQVEFDNVEIKNNIIKGFKDGNYADGSVVARANFDSPSVMSNIYFDHNICYDCSNSGVPQFLDGLTPSPYYYSAPITSAPSFMSATDYHIASPSAVQYHAGTDVGLSVDFDDANYDETAPSVGCYEYGSTSSLVGIINGSTLVDGALQMPFGGWSQGVAFVSGVLVGPPQPESGLLEDLEGYWKLDEASGDAIDSVGSLDGTASNITYGNGGILNDSFTFNGSSSDVDMGENLKITGSVSVAVWFYTSSTASNVRMAGNDTWSGGFWRGYYLGMSGGQVRWSIADGTGNVHELYSATGMADSSWHLAIGVYDGSYMYLYIDGNLYDSDPWTYDPSFISGQEFHLGSTQGDGGFYTGRLDEVAVWSRALTADEADALWNGGDGLGYPFGGTGGGGVPDTNDFCLSEVCAVVNPPVFTLDDCFDYSIDAYFDPIYKGSKDRLSNFRNYGSTAGSTAYASGLIQGIATVSGTFSSSLDPLYGYLYNWYAVDDARYLANTGWHVMTRSEASTLALYIDGDAEPDNNTVGGSLKKTGTTYWNSPNTDAADTYGFSLVGGGYRGLGGGFNSINVFGGIWHSDELLSESGYCSYAMYNDGIFRTYISGSGGFGRLKYHGLNVRLVKDDSTDPGTYTGNDGKTYDTIKIGNLVFIKQALRETEYRNHDSIANVTDNSAWAALTTGAYCTYNNL